MKPVFIFCVSVPFIFLGCAQPVIDASSEANFLTSLDKITKSLPRAKRLEFHDSIDAFTRHLDQARRALGPGENAEALKDHIAFLNGLTGMQVINWVNELTTGKEGETHRWDIREITELKNEISEWDTGQRVIKRVEVLESRFIRRQETDSLGNPIIEITFLNRLDRPISRIHFDAILASPGRKIPWAKESLVCNISGGLQPGETATLKFVSDSNSDLQTVEPKADTALTIKVNRLGGPEDKQLFDVARSYDEAQERLELLKERVWSRLNSHRKGADLASD